MSKTAEKNFPEGTNKINHKELSAAAAVATASS